jgi:hypothetical protein
MFLLEAPRPWQMKFLYGTFSNPQIVSPAPHLARYPRLPLTFLDLISPDWVGARLCSPLASSGLLRLLPSPSRQVPADPAQWRALPILHAALPFSVWMLRLLPSPSRQVPADPAQWRALPILHAALPFSVWMYLAA